MTCFPHPPLVPLLAGGREAALRPLLVQLVVIMLAAGVGAVIARWLRQPSVVGGSRQTVRIGRPTALPQPFSDR
jgi:hypothetical protein